MADSLSTERTYRSSALHLCPPAALQAHVADSQGEKEERCIREKVLWERKCKQEKRINRREQPVNLKSLLSQTIDL